ncbi:MAG: diguanylate cyclase [Pseudodesulfovibrio sp.]
MHIAQYVFSRRLSRQILLKVLLFGVLVVTVATVSCYYLVYQQTRNRTLLSLRQYMFERKQVEESVFLDAAVCLDLFRDEFLRLYLSDVAYTDADFWRLYATGADGATRMRERYFTGVIDPVVGRSFGVTSFIGNNQPFDSADLRRRLLIAYTLVNRYGPAWEAIGVLHATYPENAITLFSPDVPWGLQAKPDLPMNELGTIKATLQSENPERTPVWTGLYYDETVDNWTITYELPVDHEGRHLVNPSFDVHLKSIMRRLDGDSQAGTHSFLLSRDGYLIAHPGELRNELKRLGQLSLEKLGDPDLTRIYGELGRARPDGNGIAVTEDAAGGGYLISAELSGPRWWLVMVLSKDQLAHDAHQAARIVLLFGFLLFAVYYVTVYFVVSRHVKEPLRELQDAVAKVAIGDYDAVLRSPQTLPLTQKNEIGELAGMFLEMCRKINDVQSNLQELVNSRTRELEDANAQLRELSLLDGLTGIHNRRSFDKDIAAVFRQGQEGVASFHLMLIDVDRFKNYNDAHGHTEGDKALRLVAQVVAANIRREDRAYRYGGEEIAVIFNSADADAARRCGDRILEAVRAADIAHHGSEHGILTISAGLVGYCAHFATVTDMVDAADNSLYRAKSSGRNCLRVDGED